VPLRLRILKRAGGIVGLAMVASLAICAVAVASASATTWKANGSLFTNGQSETVTASNSSSLGGTGFTLESKVLGKAFKLTATTLTGSEVKISQSGSEALDSGKLIFSGLTVVEPSGCGVETITTEPLSSKLETKTGLTSGLADHLFPTSGETFAKIKVTTCAIAGTYPVKGSVYGETNKLGVLAVNQPLKFSPAINTAAGGKLLLGTEEAKLTGTGINTLSGTNAGKSWGAE
jgi:hypothetical protein